MFKRTRLNRRAARLREQRFSIPVPEPWMLPEQHSLIASYPRSGNTWLSTLVADVLLQQQGFETDTKLPIDTRELIPDLDRGDLETSQHIDFAPIPIAKTHLGYLPWMQKGVFLLRQPADTLLSYFHFHNRYENRRCKTRQGLNAFCKAFAEEWYGHALSFIWTCEAHPEWFRPIAYESLLSQPREVLGEVLSHLEITASEFQIERAVSNHEFSKYSTREPGKKTNERFYRNGKKDSALEELDHRTLNWVNALCWPLYERALDHPMRIGEQLAAIA